MAVFVASGPSSTIYLLGFRDLKVCDLGIGDFGVWDLRICGFCMLRVAICMLRFEVLGFGDLGLGI